MIRQTISSLFFTGSNIKNFLKGKNSQEFLLTYAIYNIHRFPSFNSVQRFDMQNNLVFLLVKLSQKLVSYTNLNRNPLYLGYRAFQQFFDNVRTRSKGI
jgi:hypothetical protein